jgi:hypothetical protein
MGHEIQLRTFRDEADLEWEVRAITPTTRQDRRVPTLPADHANGGLLFTAGVERRRLAPFPPSWHLASEAQPQRWCAEATPVEPADLGRLSHSASASTEEPMNNTIRRTTRTSIASSTLSAITP